MTTLSRPHVNIWIVPSVMTVAIVAVDQLTKNWIWRTLGPVEGTSIPLIGDWLRFTFVKNTGVAFGMFQNIPQLFTITSIIISLCAIYFYRYHLPNRHIVIQICLGLILGGAIGNIIDRLRLNYVIDFVHVSWFPGIFNLADACITIGTILLAVFLLFWGERGESGTSRPENEALLNDLLNRDGWQQPGDRGN